MLGYNLIIACGLIMTLEALTGVFVVRYAQIRHMRGVGPYLTFSTFAAIGLLTLFWAGMRESQTYWSAPGVVDIELSTNQSDVQLQRIATVLGVNPHRPTPVVADDIIERLPSTAWHVTPAQAENFGHALDEVQTSNRFKIILHSIPSSSDSVTFSDDLIALMRLHGWTVDNRRDFGIKRKIHGIMIAVSPDTQTENALPLPAKRLIGMLEKAGWTSRGVVMRDLRPGEFQLVIGDGPK